MDICIDKDIDIDININMGIDMDIDIDTRHRHKTSYPRHQASDIKKTSDIDIT